MEVESPRLMWRLFGLSADLYECEKLLQSKGELVRDVMADLRPPGLDELGLAATLTGYASHASRHGSVPITVEGEFTPRLPRALEIALYRMAQEAVVNVLKHANAGKITLTLASQSDMAIFTIADDGAGFDVTAPSTDSVVHLGLVNMRERAQSIGGDLRIESARGRGTRAVVQVPRNTQPQNWRIAFTS